MSSNKRRKLDGQDPPQTAVSALSAISARRRLAGEASSREESPSTPEPKSAKSSANAFSVLQNLSRQGDSPSLAAATVTKTPRSAVKKKGDKAFDPTVDDVASKSVQFSSFRPTKRNYRVRSDGVTELRLEESERFLVLGSFGVKILEGEMTVAGASLRPSSDIQWIHAPHCHAVPVLRTRENTRLELHGDPNAPALRQLGQLSPLFRKIWNESDEKPKRQQPFQILYSSEDAPKRSIIQDLISPPEWNKAFSALLDSASNGPLITLVCGPKSAGKSTFSRLLLNRLVSRRAKDVAVLDLDPGQPEFGPPGILSLVHVTQPNLSAPFTHPCGNALRGHALASVSPASDPELYMECAIDLYQHYCQNLNHLPLIINTPGWILGTGLELLEAIIKHVQPGQVVYMSEEGPAETVEALQAATTTNFAMLPSQPAEFTARTAAHLRAMQMMSYFHLTQLEPKNRLRWNPSPLSSVPPWLVSYGRAGCGLAGILSYDYQSPPELLAETINGMVLAAVEVEDCRAYRGLLTQGQTQPRTLRTPEGIPFIPNPDDSSLSPQYCQVIGLVLIRGIDVERQQLQLITPIPQARFDLIKQTKREIVLVHGKFDPPNWAYMEDLYLKSRDDDVGSKTLEIEQEDTSEDNSDMEPDNVEEASDMKAVPWVEILKGNQKRPVGSKVWRVRRDLGRNNGDG